MKAQRNPTEYHINKEQSVLLKVGAFLVEPFIINIIKRWTKQEAEKKNGPSTLLKQHCRPNPRTATPQKDKDGEAK